MAILSTFYDTSATEPASLVTEVKWAKAHPFIGSSTYGVAEAGDFKVSAHPTLPSTVNVAAGKAWGHGVLDESDAISTVTCSVPAAGTSRWDLICLRRNWTPSAGGPTTVTSVEGGATKQIPAGRNVVPGTVDDQPLALVQWTAGQTQPTAIADLRCWAGNGGMAAVDELVLTYLKVPGAELLINGVYWRAAVGTNDAVTWVKTGELGKIPLFGAGPGPTFGATPPNGGDFLIQAGSQVGMTDQVGYGRITWPKPFPNGCLAVVLTNGDSWATSGRVAFQVAGNNPFWGTSGQGDRFSCVYVSHDTINGGAVLRPRMLHRINYVAIGW